MGPDDSKLVSSKSELKKILKTNSIDSTKSITHLRFSNLNLDTLFIDTDNTDVFIPIDKESSDMYSLSDRKANSNESVKKLVADRIAYQANTLNVSDDGSDALSGLGGGAVNTQLNHFIFWAISLSATVLIYKLMQKLKLH